MRAPVMCLKAIAVILPFVAVSCDLADSRTRRGLEALRIEATPESLVVLAGEGATTRALEGYRLLADLGITPVSAPSEAVRALISAAAGNRPEIVDYLLTEGVSPDTETPTGEPLVALCLDPDRREVLRKLLGAGAKANVRMADGKGLLGNAIASDDPALVLLLLDSGADPLLLDAAGEPALLQAVRSQRSAVLEILLGHPTSKASLAECGAESLAVAVAHNRPDFAGELLERGVPATGLATDGSKLLRGPIESFQPELIDLLLKHGADVDVTLSDGMPAARHFVLQGKLDWTRKLIDHGAPHAGKTPQPWHLVQDAINKDNVELLDLLLEEGMPPDSRTNDGDTLLALAVRYGRVQVASRLLDLQQPPLQMTREGQPLFLVAVARGNPAMVKAFLDRGVDGNLRTVGMLSESFRALLPAQNDYANYLAREEGLTPLMIAAIGDFAELVPPLLEARSDIWTLSGYFKLDAVSLAAQRRNFRALRALLRKSPDPAPDEPRIEISLKNQKATIYIGGTVDRVVKISSGRKDFPTPPGEYMVTAKHKNWVSTIYKVPMPYFLRLNSSAIGLHAGNVPGYPASHGCIRLPKKDARELFATLDVGTPVRIDE